VLWNQLGHEGAVANASWPQVDESALETDSMQLVVQVNGKVRGKIEVAIDTENHQIEQLALNEHNTQRFIKDLEVRKLIIVPGKLVNIVAN